MCGLLLMQALPTWHIQPGIYAMCAATAMLGGVFRASISLVIIVVEGTQVLRPPGDKAKGPNPPWPCCELGCVFRASISLVIIVVEGTQVQRPPSNKETGPNPP